MHAFSSPARGNKRLSSSWHVEDLSQDWVSSRRRHSNVDFVPPLTTDMTSVDSASSDALFPGFSDLNVSANPLDLEDQDSLQSSFAFASEATLATSIFENDVLLLAAQQPPPQAESTTTMVASRPGGRGQHSAPDPLPSQQHTAPEATQTVAVSTRQQALVRFGGSDENWALTYAFFCDEQDQGRAIERKRFFERWLKRHYRDERHLVSSAHLVALRRRGWVPSACKNATLMPIGLFDEIADKFNESRTRDTINVRRNGIEWVAFGLGAAAEPVHALPATRGDGDGGHIGHRGENGTAAATTSDAMPALRAFACAVCGSTTDVKACGGCAKVSYCSVDCQSRSWHQHQHACNTK
jgi:hypothetical protein